MPDTPPQPRGLLTNIEAADYLSVQPGTLEVWRSTGRVELEFCKIGRCVRYRTEDLDRFLAEQTRVITR